MVGSELEQIYRNYSKNSSDGVREFSGLVIFASKRSGIQQSGLVHLQIEKKLFFNASLTYQTLIYRGVQSTHGISGLNDVKK